MEKHGKTQHCSEDVITAYLAGIAEREDANHVAACLDCYARVERARIEMEQLHAVAEALTSRPEHFWNRQRVAIMDRIPEVKPRLGYRWLWASSAALAVRALAVFLFLWPRQDHRAPTQAAQDADDILLTRIENDVQRPVPRALEPATLLVRARNDMAQSSKQHTSGGVQE